MKLLTLSKLMDYFENIVIDFNKSGLNGIEFELLGGCGACGKSSAKAYQTTRNIYPEIIDNF